MRESARSGAGSAGAVYLVLLGALALRIAAPQVWTSQQVRAWSTVFGAICLQASPYVLLGVLLAALVSLVPPSTVRRALPRRRAVAVPVAALGAAAIPGCECGSVPLAGTLMRNGVAVGPAVAVMLSAPATNPVVLVATSAAFPGRPSIVLARFLASTTVAIVVGLLTRASPAPMRSEYGDHDHGRRVVSTAVDELAHGLALLAIGGAAAASVIVFVPSSAVDVVSGNALASVAALATLGVLAGVCSSADGFVAASFVRFSTAAQLAFMVVGPVVGLKVLSMQCGLFGFRFTARVAIAAFVSAVLCSVSAAAVLR